MSQIPLRTLHFACVRLLRPLARVLLRHGVTVHEFSRFAEAAFVAAADDVLTEQDRKPSFSKISSITGIHRHAVSSLHAAIQRDPLDLMEQKEYQRNRVARVLSGWFEHPDFTDRDGRPKVLALQGSDDSFAELVRRFSGDIYPGIILEELQRVGAARLRADGAVQVTSRRYSSGGASSEAIEHLGGVATDVLGTLEHNLTAGDSARLFEDSAVALKLPAGSVPLFKRWVDRRAGPLLNDLEGWLAEQESRPSTGSGSVRAGLSIVSFVDPTSGQND